MERNSVAFCADNYFVENSQDINFFCCVCKALNSLSNCLAPPHTISIVCDDRLLLLSLSLSRIYFLHAQISSSLCTTSGHQISNEHNNN